MRSIKLDCNTVVFTEVNFGSSYCELYGLSCNNQSSVFQLISVNFQLINAILYF